MAEVAVQVAQKLGKAFLEFTKQSVELAESFEVVEAQLVNIFRGNEQFLGQREEESGVAFIPMFSEKEDALMCTNLMVRDKKKKYGRELGVEIGGEKLIMDVHQRSIGAPIIEPLSISDC